MEKTKKQHMTRKDFLQQLSLGLSVLGTGIFFPGSLSAADFILGETTNPKKIVILGAGLAGLSAAWELRKAGHHVQVLEARNRPGGRVSTLSDPFSPGLRVEEGAAGFSGTYSHALKFIDAFGLEKVDFAFPEGKDIFYLNGKRIESVPGEPVDWPYELHPREKGKVPMELVKMYIIDTLPKEIGKPDLWNQDPLVQMDQESLAEYLQKQGASEGAREIIQNTMWFGSIPHQTSAISTAISDMGLFMGGMPFVLKDGNDALPRELARRMKDQVVYGQEVTQVHENGDGLEVGTRSGEQYKADEVIVAVPLKVTQNIAFDPPLSTAKRQALENMPVIDLTRVFLEVDQPFWTTKGLSGMAYTDTGLGQVNAYRNHQDPEQGPALLEGYVAGPHAEKLGKIPKEEAVRETRREMEKVHPGTDSHFQEGYVKAWSSDPYALGGPSWPSPGDVTAYLEHLQAPEGKIHFAGEHTSILRSTMEGALRSGVRAAREIHEKV